MDNCSEVSDKLIEKWKLYKRAFVWRNNPSPYEIMIAEFMLQRTKAKQVEPVYIKFLKKYPDVMKLSKARAISVSKFTNNLGLHKRGQNFTNAARFIVSNYKGIFPETREELLKIPGIGDYVAGAILTVCFNKPENVIDSNIARFINRFYGLNLKGEIRRKKQIIEKAKELFNYSDTKSLLFAFLDFTALICTPLKPKCDKCFFLTECNYNCKAHQSILASIN